MFHLVKFIWDNKCLPTNIVEARFKMLFKNKGFADEPKKYRCIGLVNHSYKVIANVVLARVLECQEGFTQD